MSDNQSFGMDVEIRFKSSSPLYCPEKPTTTLYNVTEIHYNYRNQDFQRLQTRFHSEVMVAFESDFHGTGHTYSINDDVLEFEAKPAIEISEPI